MKKLILFLFPAAILSSSSIAQDLKTKNVPALVKEALAKKYPKAVKVSWEKEKGNYEANWGGKSGEDTSVQFTPAGVFVEQSDAISVTKLPVNIAEYVKTHYNGAKIKEASKVTDAAGNKMLEAEIKGADLLFSESGSFIKKD
jgi:hypothetical protein